MNEYARMRGKQVKNPAPQVVEIERPQPRELTDAEAVEVAEKRRLVLQHMPELVPEIKELVQAGLIDGWRNVRSVTVFKKESA
mgnify:CR=1 FL=1